MPLLLLVAPDAGDGPVRTAIALADARAEAGHRTVLADATFDHPRLHDRLGVRNLEGLADVFLFGASLARVRVRPDGHAFEFVPPGAYVPEPGAVLESSGWDHVEWELENDESLMVLFVPAGTPGLGLLSARAGRAILIGSDDEAARMRGRLDPSCRVAAVISPTALRTRAVEAEEEPETAEGPLESLTEPVVFRETPEKRPARPSPVLLVLIVLAVSAGGWFLYREVAASPAERDPVETVAGDGADEPASAADRGRPVETAIEVSVAVEAHQDLSSALDRADALRRDMPDVDFYLAPVAVNGDVYYRLLAGPVTDRQAGSALMQRLVEEGHKTAFDSWAIRPTPEAFLLGEFDTRGQAEARVERLLREGIPSYVVEIRYRDGDPRFRIYGGAYQSAAEATVMEEMLVAAGIEPRLVPRIGQPIPGDS